MLQSPEYGVLRTNVGCGVVVLWHPDKLKLSRIFYWRVLWRRLLRCMLRLAVFGLVAAFPCRCWLAWLLQDCPSRNLETEDWIFLRISLGLILDEEIHPTPVDPTFNSSHGTPSHHLCAEPTPIVPQLLFAFDLLCVARTLFLNLFFLFLISHVSLPGSNCLQRLGRGRAFFAVQVSSHRRTRVPAA